MDFNQVIQNFQAAMFSHGIIPSESIIADGQLHRFYIQGDKKGSKNGWYTVFIDNIPCGVYGSWKTGNSYKWCAKTPECMSKPEYTLFQKQMLDAKQKREEVHAKEQANAAKKAGRIYNNCRIADSNHPYLVNKRIKPFCARQKGKHLVLPIIDFSGNYWSLQYIAPDGEKRFLPKGAIAKHFIPIRYEFTQSLKILICEGFATGATLADAYPESCVIAACNANNLKSVALEARIHLPTVEIIIGADIDRVGITKAREAAIAAKASLIKPNFPLEASKKLSDFNDLFCWFDLGGIIA